MMKRKNLIIIGVVLFLVIFYFGYKSFNLLVMYNLEYYGVFDKGAKFLNYHKNLEEGQEYLEFKNIKIRNDFSDFLFLDEYSTDDSYIYKLTDENGNQKAAFLIGVDSTFLEYLKSGIDVFSDVGIKIRKRDLENLDEFLKENGIDNDVELFRYMMEYKDDNNIFTSTKEMRVECIFNYLMSLMLPGNSGMTLIDGNYVGYIFHLNNGAKEVNILYYNKRYVFTFLGEGYFSDEDIYELLDTLVIESSLGEDGRVDLSKYESSIFIRTYNIVERIDNNSLEYNSFKIKEFQGKEEIIDIKKDLSSNIEIGKNYEFTFKKSNNKDIEDNIKSIFENSELISVIETDKVGLEQVQDKIN